MSRLAINSFNAGERQEAASSNSSSGNGDLSFPAIGDELLKIPWFHPNMNRNMAEHILIGTDRTGSYLLRNFRKGGPDDLAVSVRSPDGTIRHFTIIWEGDGYNFGKHKFKNLNKLLEHFQNIPAIATPDSAQKEGVLHVELRYPYPRIISEEEKAAYGDIQDHIERAARPIDIYEEHDTDIADPEFEIRQKSGFLTKRGDCVKNWKCRWFVIQKNWMRYYVSKSAVAPRGVIDFTKAIGAYLDDSYDNGFTVVIPGRVYYIQASNAEEREEWMGMVTWKLDYYNPKRDKKITSPPPLNPK